MHGTYSIRTSPTPYTRAARIRRLPSEWLVCRGAYAVVIPVGAGYVLSGAGAAGFGEWVFPGLGALFGGGEYDGDRGGDHGREVTRSRMPRLEPA